MNRSVLVTSAFAALLIASVGCGGGDLGSGNDVINRPPANVAGVWSGVTNNAGSAILIGCTGDFASFNGLTVAEISSGASCVDSGPLEMTQSGATLTAQPVTYACDSGDFGSKAGGGTVAGQSLSVQLDTISEHNGSTGSDYFAGAMLAADTIALSENGISVSGSMNGTCNISPNLSITVTILPPVQGPTPESRPRGQAFSLGPRLMARRSTAR